MDLEGTDGRERGEVKNLVLGFLRLGDYGVYSSMQNIYN